MARGQRLNTTILALIFVVLVFGLLAVLQYKPAPAPARVQCAPYLAQVYGYEGELANVTMSIKDSINNNPISGANVYIFDEKPYYFGQVNQFRYIGSMISGKTPAGTSGSDGKLSFEVAVPYADEREKTYYLALIAQNYWSELYTAKVGFSPVLQAPTQDECIRLFPRTDIKASDLIQVSLTRVLDGKQVSLTKVQMDKIGAVDVPGNVSLGVSTTESAKKLVKTVNVFVSDGYLRVDGISFNKISLDGVKRIEVEVKKGTTTLLKEVLYDELNPDSPLAKENSKVYNELGGKDVIVVNPGEGISITLTVIADTEATASPNSGRLGPGEAVLSIDLLQSSPLENTPITIQVQG